MPSHQIFLTKNGLSQKNISIKHIPYFIASFELKDIINRNKEIRPNHLAEPLNIDFYIETTKEYQATNRAKPIWDGRVYEENNIICIGG